MQGATMVNQVQGIKHVDPIARPGSLSPQSPASGDAFSGIFEKAVSSVQSAENSAGEGIERMLNGESEEVHQTILSAQRAELAFDMFLQVRNKVVQAYQEVMRMQV
jgi:flagellar hook-basal body complex protein FliE